ncbi:MAG TPA: hypothetical protein VGF60_23485 [Xanthobacteraceae bacterium]|jgi:hypothetical protein
MGKRESSNDKRPDPTTPEPAPDASAAWSASPGSELRKLELPAIATIAVARADAPMITDTLAPLKIGLGSIDAPKIAPDMDELKPPAAQPRLAHSAVETPSEPAQAEATAPRLSRFTVLAASLALAAAIGGMLGALATSRLPSAAPPAPGAGRTGIEEIQALKENVVQARVELAAMKAALDAGNRTTATHLTRIGERVDRIERSQAEPAAKLSKAIETLDRLSRPEAAAREVTGSIAPAPSAAAPPANPAVLDAWVVRDVRHGTALLENRRLGLIEVERGDVVPGLGRIDEIRKQDGRWMVVTSKGTIR